MSGLTDGIQGNLCLSSLYLVNYTNTVLVLEMIIYSLSEFYHSDCNEGQAEELKAVSNLKIVEDGGRRHVSRLPDL